MMYRVEWDDQEGNRHEQYFDRMEDAQMEAARLRLMFDYVAIKYPNSVGTSIFHLLTIG